MRDGLIGLIDTPMQGSGGAVAQVLEAAGPWCADNGCFGKGYPGDDAWWAWLESRRPHADTCLFAVAPDVVGDAAATTARSLPWLPRIRALGFPAAYVAQNGLEDLDVPWHAFDVLFLGGSLECLPCGFVWPSDQRPERRQRCPHCHHRMREWKLGAAARQLVAEAKARGKRVHMGRVNSEDRYRYAMAIGCDSADGTFLTFGPDLNLPKVIAWSRLADHHLLPIA
jgi:hypothetical protein